MKSNVLLNKLFTVNSFNDLIFRNKSQTYLKTIDNVLGFESENMTNLSVFQSIYKYMARHHRNEYFYKNAILNKILLGRHSVRTSTAIRELPVSGNILDFLIINGVGNVYEIKTELDNLSRLRQQISSYYEAFSFCTVVTDESHVEAVKKTLDLPQVGVMVLTKRNTLHVNREAIEYTQDLRHATLFKLLRKPEFEQILANEFGKLPDTNQFKYYDACFSQFKNLDILVAQKLVLKQLKKRASIDNSTRELFECVPSELKTLVYFSNYKVSDFGRLRDFLSQGIGEVN